MFLLSTLVFSKCTTPGNPVISREQLKVLPFYKEPYENALRVERVPLDKFLKVPPAIPEPIIPLHQTPPNQQPYYQTVVVIRLENIKHPTLGTTHTANPVAGTDHSA